MRDEENSEIDALYQKTKIVKQQSNELKEIEQIIHE